MGSIYKFPSGLNNWIDSDKPERIDFVEDNEIIDENAMWKEYYDPHNRELEYQPKEESTLQTTVKNVPGAINEINTNKRNKNDNEFTLASSGANSEFIVSTPSGNSTKISSAGNLVTVGDRTTAGGGNRVIISGRDNASYTDIAFARSGSNIYLLTDGYIDARSITNNSTFIAMRASAFTVISAKKNKKKIKDISVNIWEKIKTLKPKQYFMKWDEEEKDLKYGFIADDSVDAAPNLIVYDEDGTFEAFDYMQLIPIYHQQLVKQEERIDKLEKQVKELLEKTGMAV